MKWRLLVPDNIPNIVKTKMLAFLYSWRIKEKKEQTKSVSTEKDCILVFGLNLILHRIDLIPK